MNKGIAISFIISTYNWPEALELSLHSISHQTILPSEIIIADDGSDKRTETVIQKFASQTSIPVFHMWHEDNGFRKAIILNKAIQKTRYDYIIQIDGDIIVDKHFIEDHLNAMEEGCFIRGTRANLSTSMSTDILAKKKISFNHKIKLIAKQMPNALRLPLSIASLCTRKEQSGKKVKGCNMSFWRKDLLAVNGYNSLLQGWGHEDEELSWRLVNNGISKKIIKFSAIAYHIYHKQLPRTQEPSHCIILQRIIQEKTTWTNEVITSKITPL